MELVTPDKDELFAFIDEFSDYFPAKMLDIVFDLKDNVDNLISSYGFKNLADVVKQKNQILDNLLFRFQKGFENKLLERKNNLKIIEGAIQSFNIGNTLKRGFTLIQQDNKYITRKNNLVSNKKFNIKFYDGDTKINE